MIPDEPPGKELLPLVFARLATVSEPWQPAEVPPLPAPRVAAGGKWGPVPERGLERLLGGPEFYSPTWYRKGLECARQVARVETLQGNTVATGFLVWGSELHPSLPDEPVLLTTSYVVTDDPVVKDRYAFSVLGPDEVQARFQDETQVYSLTVVWTSFLAGTTILRLTPRLESDRRLAVAQRFPVVDAAGQEPTRAFIVGHPGGRDLSFSMQDNFILDCDDRVVHYRTPTEAGSSGSPVFNRLWQLIAIHYAGGNEMHQLHGHAGTYAANEGIRIDFIRSTIAAEAEGTVHPSAAPATS